MDDAIGIDVSKDWLDGFSIARAEHRRFANDGRGLRALHRWVETGSAGLVVFEASGVYHRRLENSLSEAPPERAIGSG